MKKLQLLALLAISVISCTTSPEIEKPNEKPEDHGNQVSTLNYSKEDVILSQIWIKYTNLVDKYFYQGNLEEIIEYISPFIINGDISFTSKDFDETSLLDQMKSDYNFEQKTVEIEISRNLINNYNEYESIIYAMLTYEISQIYLFLSDYNSFNKTLNNKFSKIKLEIDAIELQSDFVKKISSREFDYLSKYEEFIQYHTDEYFFYVKKVSPLFIKYFIQYKEKNSGSINDYIDKIIELGNDGISVFNEKYEDSNDKMKYLLLISNETFIDLTIYSLLYLFPELESEVTIRIQYPVIDEIIVELSRMNSLYNSSINDYRINYIKENISIE